MNPEERKIFLDDVIPKLERLKQNVTDNPVPADKKTWVWNLEEIVALEMVIGALKDCL